MKAMTRIAALLTASALAFGMVGCSSETSSEPINTNADEAQTYTSEEIGASDFTIEKSGYSTVAQTTIDAQGNEVSIPAINFAFIVKNDNAGYVAENVPFNVNGYNAAGELVFSGGANCRFIYPGIDTAVSSTAPFAVDEGKDNTIDSITIEPLMDTVEWLKTNLTNEEIADMFTVEEVSAVRTDNDLTVSAAVTGNLDDCDRIYKTVDLENTLEGHCVAIFTDSDGNILFGSDSSNVLIDQTTLDATQSEEGEEAVSAINVSIMIPDAPDYADFQLYVMPGL